MNPSRRRFLVRTGWTCAGLTVLAASGCSLVPALPTFGGSEDGDTLTWVQILPDGRARLRLPRAEMGQGIATGFSQIVAEELHLPLEAVECVPQDTDAMAPCRMTVGSQSVEDYAMLVARAAARLRTALARRAAARLDVPAATLDPIDGGFRARDGRTATYGQLVGAPELLGPDPEESPELFSRRPPARRRVVGRPVPAVGLDRIVRGGETYSRDVRLPDMLHGAVVRPPQIGATPTAFDRSAAERADGVVALVEHDGQIGVVARTPREAERAVEALRVRWTTLGPTDVAAVQRGVDVERDIEHGLIDHSLLDRGSIAEGRERAVTELSLRFDSPMVAHAALEPRSGTASWHRRDDGDAACEVWTGSQDPWLIRSAVAKTLGMNDSRIVVRNHRLGGAFGGRVLCQASVEAAWLSRAVARPVKVQWSREDEFRHNYVGPPYSSLVEAGLDARGRVAYWSHRAVGAPILTSSTLVPPYLHWAANLVADPGTERGMTGPYRFANHRVRFGDVRLPVPSGPWRGLGAAPNAFAVESAMDELAEAAGADPIAFRLDHLENPRLAHCLRRLRTLVPDGASGMGVAAAAYKGVTFVAVAARVTVRDDRPSVSELYCVHDCGRMLSPDQVRAQVEGCLAWGVGMALHERLALRDGAVDTADFVRYRLARQRDVPDAVIELVDSDHPPSGAGEAAFVPVAAAIANATYAATGTRRRRLPLIPSRS